MTSEALRLKLLDVGAMSSPRYAPAGLFVLHSAGIVMLDGGAGAEPEPPSAAWLVTDLRAKLIAQIRRLARARGLEPAVRAYEADGLAIVPQPVAHTNHPTWGYLMSWRGHLAAWAPEFSEFPAWASGVELMFADAAGWRRPIRFGAEWEVIPRSWTRLSARAGRGAAPRTGSHRESHDSRAGGR